MPFSPEPALLRAPKGLAAAGREDRLGSFFPLLLAFPLFEYGRPAHPLGIPMVLSSLLLLGWLLQGAPRWHSQVRYFLALIALMCVGTLLAVNTHSAFWTTYNVAVTLLGTCIPLICFTTSLRKITLFIYALLSAFAYCALYAINHKGMGPGWQDENYAAALMSMAFPFAYFSIFIAKRMFARVALAMVAGLMVAAVVVSFSRGGFLGMAIVLVYCVIRSPRRWPLMLVAPVLAAAIALFATPSYWAEMQTISDPTEKTAELRLDLWSIAYRMFEDSPLIGVGPGNYIWNVRDYQTEEQFARYGRSLAASAVTHSVYLEVLAELGLIGTILVGGILYRNYADLRFVARETRREHEGAGAGSSDGRRARYYERAITGSFIGVLTCGATVSILYYSHLWILTAMAVALKEATRGLADRRGTEGERAPTPPRPWWQANGLPAGGGRPPAAGDLAPAPGSRQWQRPA